MTLKLLSSHCANLALITSFSRRHLPANLVASFVKRLSRLSLTAPPAAVIMLIPFTYNVMRQHPALMCMIHRTDDAGGIECGKS